MGRAHDCARAAREESLVKLAGDSGSLGMTRGESGDDDRRDLARAHSAAAAPAGYLLGALACGAMMGWALWLQYGSTSILPLCSLQRMAVIGIGLVFSSPASTTRAARASIYAGLTSHAGIVRRDHGDAPRLDPVAAQGEVPECGMGLNYMIETMPLSDVLAKVFTASGECAEGDGCSWVSRSRRGRSCSSLR
jgi:disulfide bond formation protein DsbB